MADRDYKVAYHCAWCYASFHDIDEECHAMAIYTDKEGRQFCSEYCKRMYHEGEYKSSIGKS